MFTRRLQHDPRSSLLLLGPRGTGKSTWVRHELKPAVTLDLLESDTYHRLLASPRDLESLLPARNTDVVAIDEIQRVPELLNEVHRLIELRGQVFALTGSSARRQRRAGVNLLAGRARSRQMFPLTADELGSAFRLDHSLAFGHLPAAHVAPDPLAFLQSYVHTYLREEVLQEGLVRNLAAFGRFLQAASFSHGGLLSISEVARECAVERKSVENWFQILEDLFIAFRVPVFTRRTQRALVAHPKFYFFDAGVFQVLRPRGPLDRPEGIAGAALEGLVCQDLRATVDLHRLGLELFHWRTKHGAEVDFVLYGEGGLIAVEVKHADRVRSEDLRGLRAFKEDYPMARLLFLYRGARRERVGDVHVIPVEEALLSLPSVLSSAEPS